MAAAKKKSDNTKKAGASRAKRAPDPLVTFRMYEEIKAIVLLAVGAFLVFAMFANGAGAVGEGVAYGCKGVLGAMAYVLPFVLIVYSVAIFANKGYSISVRTHIFVAILFVMLMLLISAFWLMGVDEPLEGSRIGETFRLSAAGKSGGVIGMFLGSAIIGLIGNAGLFILSIAVLAVSAILLARTTITERLAYIAQVRADRREKRAAREEEERRIEEAERDAQRKLARGEAPRGTAAADPAHALDGRQAPRIITDGTEFADPDYAARPRSAFRSFLDGLRPGRKDNFVDALENEDAYVTGRTGSGASSQAPPSADVDAYDEAGGHGLEPLARPRDGYGLGDYDADVAAPDPGASEGDSAAAVAGGAAGGATGSGWKDSAAPKRKKEPPRGLEGDAAGFTRKKNTAVAYKLPPIDLLKKSSRSARSESDRDLQLKAQKLEETLRDFRVDARVLNVTVGPTVTRYEVEPDVGVKIQSIKSLEPDLALRLEVKSVRVVPMPGQAVVGIEAYNEKRNIVALRDIIDSEEFRDRNSKIAFALGKNISGERIIADLSDMPHLLIAGTTGSGKSVCINSILLSILYRAAPDEVKLILVDPKVVELKPYSDIPHLMLPVVTNPERAATALGYAVTIMNERYAKFAEFNVRNLEGYNDHMLHEGRDEEVLPQIVIVIDELSDLMMIAPQKVQESISRLAAMARAAGMHLIVATQQPLASILTSVIKANIPSRIAFSVSSNSSSRVILDEPGAERLHGKGDMLFSPVGTREPMRVQGAFVSEAEVYKVTEYVKKEMDPDYSPDILDAIAGPVSGELTEDEDDLFRDAVEAVVAAKQASVSMLQRRFRIGYNRAARLVDMMEERGMVAASDGTNKPRKVIISEAQYESFMAGSGAAAASAEAPADYGEPDVSGAQIPVQSHAIYGGAPGAEPADGDTSVRADDDPPFDTDQDE